MEIEKLTLQCHCGDTREHAATFQFDESFEDFVLISTSMNHYLPWYRRIFVAIKYLCGIDNTYVHYTEGLYDKVEVEKLKRWIDLVSTKIK